MTSIVALLALVCFTVAAGWSIWWVTRRALNVSLLKDAAVSRQWLIDHQSDD